MSLEDFISKVSIKERLRYKVPSPYLFAMFPCLRIDRQTQYTVGSKLSCFAEYTMYEKRFSHSNLELLSSTGSRGDRHCGQDSLGNGTACISHVMIEIVHYVPQQQTLASYG